MTLEKIFWLVVIVTMAIAIIGSVFQRSPRNQSKQTTEEYEQ